MKKLKKFFRELLWKRCEFCNEKKKWFFYLYEISSSLYAKLGKQPLDEICTDCAYNKTLEQLKEAFKK